MNPHYTPGSLFLTPRAPNGKRLPARARHHHHHHMRASEDKKPDPTSQEMQGLGGQMRQENPAGGMRTTPPAGQPQAPRGSLASQMEPHDPRWKGVDGDILSIPKYAPPAMDDTNTIRRAPTEEERRQMERAGGAKNAVPAPEKGGRELPVKPKLDFKHGKIEGGSLEGSVPWEKIFGK
ncbi:hypothetical protein [Prosthecobacter sp.]|uniref:hypothetical protein n=1 Tax=Prosthecobacter sp. TaxID=1965333 RepID=UPI003783BD0F